VFEALQKSAELRIPGVLVTLVTVNEGEKATVNRYWSTSDTKSKLPDEFSLKINSGIDNILSGKGAAEFSEVELESTPEMSSAIAFLEPVIPLPRLIIAGAGHIGKALTKIAAMLDFEITVVDDRPEFANPENIQSADHILTGDIGKTIDEIEKGHDTYIVIVTRGHRDDAAVLQACIKSGAGYIGMIGSKNKVALMRKDFIKKGLATKEEWDRIYSPVGMAINSQTVGEIAVSIAAQLVKVRNAKDKR
jgi:xanthine dehydrogenase accessory factor